MPLILSQHTDEQKSRYLMSLYDLTYKKDIVDRNSIDKPDILDTLINILASSVGSLTNPQKINYLLQLWLYMVIKNGQ